MFLQVSAPSLQECTNSHTYGIAQSFGVGPRTRSEWPESAEDYAVFAIQLQYEASLRESFRPQAMSIERTKERRNSYTGQLISFMNQAKSSYASGNSDE